MNSLPIPGSAFGADLVRKVNRLTVAAPSGMLVREGGGGTGFQPLPKNNRDRRSDVASDNGCWIIEEVAAEEEGAEPTLELKRQYYAIGGGVREGNDATDLYDFIKQGELAPGQEYTAGDKPFILLRIYAAAADGKAAGDCEIVAKKTWSEVVSAAADPRHYVVPIYKLTHEGGVAVDFRNMPTAAMWEV